MRADAVWKIVEAARGGATGEHTRAGLIVSLHVRNVPVEGSQAQPLSLLTHKYLMHIYKCWQAGGQGRGRLGGWRQAHGARIAHAGRERNAETGDTLLSHTPR